MLWISISNLFLIAAVESAHPVAADHLKTKLNLVGNEPLLSGDELAHSGIRLANVEVTKLRNPSASYHNKGNYQCTLSTR